MPPETAQAPNPEEQEETGENKNKKKGYPNGFFFYGAKLTSVLKSKSKTIRTSLGGNYPFI